MSKAKILEILNLKTTWPEKIEDIVWELDCSYVEAILIFCERNSIEPEVIAEHIKNNAILMSRVVNEAEEARIIKQTTEKLPF